MPVVMPSLSQTADERLERRVAGAGAEAARASRRSAWRPPGRRSTRVGDAEAEVLVAVEADLRVVAELGDERGDPVGDVCSRISAPAESTT